MALLRRPRFQRSAVALPFQLTSRDTEILQRVFEHRFLNSAQLARLIPGSHQQTLRRLQALFHHGYLDRPRCQIDHFHQLGTRPMVYGLGRKGARLLLRGEGSVPAQGRWRGGNDAATRFFLDHTLEVADVLIAFELACRARSDVRFVSPRQLSLQGSTSGVQWKVNVQGEEIAVIPDAVFALEIRQADGRRDRIHYFVEADRGTMPVVRKKLRQTSFVRKLLSYEGTWSQRLHQPTLGIDRFRVLTVTTTAARVGHLRDACSRLARGHGLFLFKDAQALRTAPDLLSLKWSTAKSAPALSTVLE